jgi:hypothetical protein
MGYTGYFTLFGVSTPASNRRISNPLQTQTMRASRARPIPSTLAFLQSVKPHALGGAACVQVSYQSPGPYSLLTIAGTGRCCPAPADHCCQGSGICNQDALHQCCAHGGLCDKPMKCCTVGCAPPDAQCCRGGTYCPGGQRCVIRPDGTTGCCPPAGYYEFVANCLLVLVCLLVHRGLLCSG